MRFIDLTGQRFGRLEVLVKAANRAGEVAVRATNRGGEAYWLCRCSCGSSTTVRSSSLRSGATRSCGCLCNEVRREVLANRNRARSTHGQRRGGTSTPTYSSWKSMRARCSNPKNHAWANYGGRGIRVCGRWDSFESFLADMGERPEGTTLDRIDVNGNYEPGNCRWASHKEQNANRRPTVTHAELALWKQRALVAEKKLLRHEAAA